MSSSDNRGVPQGNAAIIAAIIGGIALVAAAAIGVIIGRETEGVQQPPKEVTRIVVATVASGNSGVQPSELFNPTHTPYPPNPTYTPYPTEPPPVTVVTRASVVFTATPNADEQEPPPGSILRVGETFTKNQVAVTLLAIDINSQGVGLRLTIKNNRGEGIPIIWTQSNVHLRDDRGHSYRQKWQGYDWFKYINQFTLAPSEQTELNYESRFIASTFGYFDGGIDPAAKYLTVTLDRIGGMEDMNWQYELP